MAARLHSRVAKAAEVILPVHHAQLLSYLRLTNKPLGLLINFNVPVLVKGVKRIMNGCDAAALHSKDSVGTGTTPTENSP